jgi:hypothetical protein
LRGELGTKLDRRPGGRVVKERRIGAADGLRLVDVARVSDARLAGVGNVTPGPYPRAGAEVAWRVRPAGEGRVVRA